MAAVAVPPFFEADGESRRPLGLALVGLKRRKRS